MIRADSAFCCRLWCSMKKKEYLSAWQIFKRLPQIVKGNKKFWATPVSIGVSLFVSGVCSAYFLFYKTQSKLLIWVPVNTAASLTAIGGIICSCFIDKNQWYHISLGRYDLIIWLQGWLVQLQFVVCICTIIQICLNFRKSQIIRDLPGVAQLLERLWACGQVCRCSYLCKLGEGGHIWRRFSDASCPIQRSQRESKSHHKRHTWTRQWVRIQNYKPGFIKKDWPSVVYPNHNWMVLRWSIGLGRPV